MNVAGIENVSSFFNLSYSYQYIFANLRSFKVAAVDGVRHGKKVLCLKGLLALTFSITACFFQVPSAHAGNILENAIAATEPCKPLKAKINFFTVGIDKLERLRVDEVIIDIKGNRGIARARVFLSCKTSDAASFAGNVSANIGLDAELDLSSCQFSRNEVTIRDIGGSFGGVVDAFGEKLSSSLQAGLRDGLAKLCQ